MGIVRKSWKRYVVIKDGCCLINLPTDKKRPTWGSMKKLLNNQDGMILYDNKLFYADVFNKKVAEISVSQEKQTDVERLKKSISNREETYKKADDNEFKLIISITGRANKETTIDRMAYTFCVLDKLQSALKRRDVFISPSWRYADPRANLHSGAEWEAIRPMICRSLNLTTDPTFILATITNELDQSYRLVASTIDSNPAI